MLAILPKFYSLGNDAEVGPMRWAGNLLPLEPRLHLFEACLERMAVVERAGLIRRPGAKLRIPTAGCEIGVPFLLTDFFHRPFPAYLPPQRFPVEQKGGMEIGRAHVCTPVTNAQLVCRLLLETKTTRINEQCARTMVT